MANHSSDTNPFFDDLHDGKDALVTALTAAFAAQMPHLPPMPLAAILDAVVAAAVSMTTTVILTHGTAYGECAQWAQRLGNTLRDRMMFQFGYQGHARPFTHEPSPTSAEEEHARHNAGEEEVIIWDSPTRDEEQRAQHLAGEKQHD